MTLIMSQKMLENAFKINSQNVVEGATTRAVHLQVQLWIAVRGSELRMKIWTHEPQTALK